MGLFSGDGDMPQRSIAQFDPGTSELLQKDISGAFDKPQDKYGAIDKNLSAGTDTFNQLGNNGLLGDSTFNQAIKEKYGRGLSGDLDQLRTSERLNLRSNQLAKLKRAQQANVALQSVQNEAMTANLESQNQQEMARANAINSILNLGSMAVGYGMAHTGARPGGVDPTNGIKPTGVMNSYGRASAWGGQNQLTDFGSAGMNQSMGYRNSLEGIGNA